MGRFRTYLLDFWYEHTFTIIGIAILALILGRYVWGTDTFQETVFPEQYWQQEIKELESIIRTSNALRPQVSDEIRMRQEAQQIMDYYVQSAPSLGLTKKEAVQMAQEEIRIMRQSWMEYKQAFGGEAFIEANKRYKQKLAHAREKLQEHKK